MFYVAFLFMLAKAAGAYEYDGVVDPNTMMNWEIAQRGPCNGDYWCVDYQNPDKKAEIQTVQAILIYAGNQQMLLIMYRYEFLGQNYIIRLNKAGNYIQVYPPLTDV